MAWNPDTYNKFKTERFEPFYDLLKLINVKPGMEVMDLGCGTGELTGKLLEVLPDSTVLGIDSSKEMLQQSKAFENKQLRFEFRTIEEQLVSSQKWDLVFSNAAIQWVDHHEQLIRKIVSALKPNGQLLIQLPAQPQNISNRLLNLLAGESPFNSVFEGWKRNSPVLNTEEYARLFFDSGSKSMTVYEKIYPLVLEDVNGLFDWVSGTALLPYLDRLQGQMRRTFIDEYKIRLQRQFPGSPVFYPFKRIILSALF